MTLILINYSYCWRLQIKKVKEGKKLPAESDDYFDINIVAEASKGLWYGLKIMIGHLSAIQLDGVDVAPFIMLSS